VGKDQSTGHIFFLGRAQEVLDEVLRFLGSVDTSARRERAGSPPQVRVQLRAGLGVSWRTIVSGIGTLPAAD